MALVKPSNYMVQPPATDRCKQKAGACLSLHLLPVDFAVNFTCPKEYFMTIPAGYIQTISGNWIKQSDGSGPYVIDANGAVFSQGPIIPVVSSLNGTTTPLGGGATFTGVSEDISRYSEVRVSVFADQASATDGLKMEQSTDGTNWDVSDSYTIPASTSKSFGVGCVQQFFRMVYVNGAAAQGVMRMQVTYHSSLTKPSSVRMQDARSNENDFEEVAAYEAIFNGTNWDRRRTPNVFKTINALSIAAEATIWTPTAGKKFRLMGYMLETGTVGGNVLLKDNTAGSTILILPFGAANATLNDPGMQNGILSAAANNVLTATGAATQTLSGYVYGTEE